MSSANLPTPLDLTSPSQTALQELEPSPVEETTAQDGRRKSYFPPFPSFSSSNRSTASTLGLTGHSLSHVLQALQKYSTIPPVLYLTMHYTNTALIPLATRSLETSDKYLLLTRPYYQSFPLEQLLIFLPVATHVLSGVALRLHRRSQYMKRHGAESHAERAQLHFWPRLSLTSALGYTLYPMMVAHVYVNRILPLKYEGGSSGVGLRYFAHGMSKHPVLLNVGYAAMLGVASWHFVTGAAKFLRWSAEFVVEGGADGRRARRRRKWVINGIAAAVWTVWVAGGLGVVGRGGRGSGWEARGWDDLYLKVPLIGNWL